MSELSAPAPRPGRAGLDTGEAAARLALEGPNLLPGAEPAGFFQVLREVLSEPMLLLLLAAGAIYGVLGDALDAALMLSFVLIIIGISLAQSFKTRRALEALRDLSAPRALVIRDGVEQRIPGREVVRGDLLALHEGDRVPADAQLLDGWVSVDESLLTGESVPREVSGNGVEAVLPAGALVVKGLGWAEVTATGGRTGMGRIGSALAGLVEEDTPLQRAARRMVRGIGVFSLACAGAAGFLAWAWVRLGALPSLLAGLTLAMAIIPQEIPVVLTVFMAMGARRMSAMGVLVRRPPVLEALGAATVLAVDKTGTLTENRMRVAELSQGGERLEVDALPGLPEPFHALAEFSVLATPADPFDPMEQALQSFGHAALQGTEHLHGTWSPERAYDLSPGMMAMSFVYPMDAPELHLVAAKGAPEAVIDLCHLDLSRAAEIHAEVDAMAGRGLRVLAVARGEWRGAGLPPQQHDFDYTFLGLVGLLDPPRADVPEAIQACLGAGIRVLMMTGDHPFTALATAQRIGLPAGDGFLLGADLESMDDATLSERLRHTTVCARLRPEHKLRLVQRLQADGEIVAMTGDGVNDAPALKAAHIGVAMGARGTDVAREAAAMVLVDDRFGTLVGAVEEGRRMYGNLARSIRFIFAVHLPVLGMTLLPLLFRWPLMLLPVHIAVMEMLIDPACSIVLEAEPGEAGAMSRPPRRQDRSLFEARGVLFPLLQGAGVLVILLGVQAGAVASGCAAEVQRTRIFAPLVLSAFLQILAHRSPGRGLLRPGAPRNPWTLWTGSAVAALVLASASLPLVQRILALAPPQPVDLAWSLLAVAGSMLWLTAIAPVEARLAPIE